MVKNTKAQVHTHTHTHTHTRLTILIRDLQSWKIRGLIHEGIHSKLENQSTYQTTKEQPSLGKQKVVQERKK
jgi:hypothetical protein